MDNKKFNYIKQALRRYCKDRDIETTDKDLSFATEIIGPSLESDNADIIAEFDDFFGYDSKAEETEVEEGLTKSTSLTEADDEEEPAKEEKKSKKKAKKEDEESEEEPAEEEEGNEMPPAKSLNPEEDEEPADESEEEPAEDESTDEEPAKDEPVEDEPADEESAEEQPEESKDALQSLIDFTESNIADLSANVRNIETFNNMFASGIDKENKYENAKKVFESVSEHLNTAIGLLRAISDKYNGAEKVASVEAGKAEAEKILNDEVANKEIAKGAGIEVVEPIGEIEPEADEEGNIKDESLERMINNYTSLTESIISDDYDDNGEWEDIYKRFVDITDNSYPYLDKALKEVKSIYNKNKLNESYKKAYNKWYNSDEVQIYLSEN